MHAKTAICCLMLLCSAAWAGANDPLTGTEIPLWPDGAPEAKGEARIHQPSITYYLPEHSSGTGVVVCPGGGYGGLAMDHEGEQIAQWLKSNGIAAFVLRYRHAPLYQHPVPRMDVRRAVRLVRSRAEEFGLNPERIGVLGFSAGGHLTATSGTQFEAGHPDAEDPVERVSSRPDFIAPIYPVITMQDPYTHAGSRRNLLGEEPDPALVEQMSLETQVTADTPPAFIVSTTEDAAVPVQNALRFYEACVNAKVPATLHVFNTGRHGLGLGPDDLPFHAWPGLFIEWIGHLGLYDKP
ncbi:MAG: alpha/beta hydrolase fold domain-containing protein [Candidatus Hydrogenedens sp.]|nr:alpha/beta hydrolase fold domain-containing protein [Candidatus Hydrogenedens sp.]